MPTKPSRKRNVTVLCAPQSNVYRSFSGVTCYKEDCRPLGSKLTGPIIVYPPSDCWGPDWTNTNIDESRKVESMLTSFNCLNLVSRKGGVLVQPENSSLWQSAHLPTIGDMSRSPKLWTIGVNLKDFGHRDERQLWLLLSNIDPNSSPWLQWPVPRRTSRETNNPKQPPSSRTEGRFESFLISLARLSTPSENESVPAWIWIPTSN